MRLRRLRNILRKLGLRLQLFDFVFGLNGTVGCECCLNQSHKLLFFVLPSLCLLYFFKGNEGHLHRLIVLFRPKYCFRP